MQQTGTEIAVYTELQKINLSEFSPRNFLYWQHPGGAWLSKVYVTFDTLGK